MSPRCRRRYLVSRTTQSSSSRVCSATISSVVCHPAAAPPSSIRALRGDHATNRLTRSMLALSRAHRLCPSFLCLERDAAEESAEVVAGFFEFDRSDERSEERRLRELYRQRRKDVRKGREAENNW